MILKSRLPMALFLAAISSPSTLPAQTSGSLVDQLTQRYALTNVDPDGTVTQPGVVVSVGQHLLRANPIYGDRYQPNSYKKGRVSQPTFSKPSRANVRLADSLGFIYFNEKVYITKIDVSDSDVVFGLQTCAAYGARPIASAIYRAALSFQFPKGSVSVGNLKQIEDTVSEVLTIVGAAETPVRSSQPSTPNPTVTVPVQQKGQPGVDIVHVGQTLEEVKALLGQPDKTENTDGKVILSYTGLKVTFINGKVSDVQ